MYRTGDGVRQDDAEAVRWCRLAADQGHAYAQFNLGLKYAIGEGVQQDDGQAHMCFNVAASRDQEDAVRNRAVVANLMTPNSSMKLTASLASGRLRIHANRMAPRASQCDL